MNLFTLSFLMVIIKSSCGFSTVSHYAVATKSPSKSALKVSVPLFTEEEAKYRMEKARECAFSDSCSLEEVNEHLHEVLCVQSGCVSGVLAGADLCENQEDAAEIVAHLRQKINAIESGAVSSSATGASSMSTTALIVFAMVMIAIINNSPESTTPFTPQEWIWAAKGGYLDDMIAHYFRLGGL